MASAGYVCAARSDNTDLTCLHTHTYKYIRDVKDIIIIIIIIIKIHDSSVCIVLGYGLDDRGSRVRLPAGAGNFSLHYRVQNSSEAHPVSYPMGTRCSFPVGKAAGA
jgi:hypothetical protein